MTLQRWALGIEYDGTVFHGWQSQLPTSQLPTIQGALETALSQIADAPIQVVCAGRTDAGVHATGQVIHFDTPVSRPDTAWVRGVNALLPVSCAVRWAVPVADDFHARFCATGRRYRYILLNRAQRPAVFAGRAGWFHRPLDAALMAEAATVLPGTHDFSAFRAAECQARTPVRTLTEVAVQREGDWLVFDFAANAFLQHMIRNLVGALVYIGKGGAPVSAMGDWLAQQNRTLAPPTFMPDGLYLTGVDYDAGWGLSSMVSGSQPGNPLQIFNF
jgi:tRNA pseudouridine38-40 synthase